MESRRCDNFLESIEKKATRMKALIWEKTGAKIISPSVGEAFDEIKRFYKKKSKTFRSKANDAVERSIVGCG